MVHHFDIELAELYGLEEAIILQNLHFWIQKNEANGKHFYEGKYWTYNSLEAWAELFPYLAPFEKPKEGKEPKRRVDKIQRVLKSMEERGLIIKGNFNKASYDRTTWYCISAKCILRNRKMENAETQNAKCEIAPPIPDSKQQILNTDDNIKLHSQKFSKENISGETDDSFSLPETTQPKPSVEPKKKSNPFKLSDEEMKLLQSYHKGFIEEIDMVAKVEYSKDIRHLCRTFKRLKCNIELFRDIYIYFRTYRDPSETYTTEIRSLKSLSEKIDKLQAEMLRETKRTIKEKGSVVLFMDNIKKIAVVYNQGKLKQADKTRIDLLPKTGYRVYDISKSIGILDFSELGYVIQNTLA